MKKALEVVVFTAFLTIMIGGLLFFMVEFGKISKKAADEMAKYILQTQGEYYEQLGR